MLSCGAVLLLGCQSEVLFAWYCSVSSSTANFTLYYLRDKPGSRLGVLLADLEFLGESTRECFSRKLRAAPQLQIPDVVTTE